MKLWSFLPYLIVFIACAAYLLYRMRTAMMAPRRRGGSALWHERGRAQRRLRISRTWDDLGHHEPGQESKPDEKGPDA
jgi:hypothetical protein